MSLSQILAPTLKTVKANWRPMVVIQIAAILVVVAYYQVEAVRDQTAKITAVRATYGLLFNTAAIWISSLFVPIVARAVTRSPQEKLTGPDLLLLLSYFAGIGVVLDLWYQAMTSLFGDSYAWNIVLGKFALDQLIFSPLISMPVATTVFLYKEDRYRWSATRKNIREGIWWARYIRTLAMCWMFWPPIVLALYTLPANLQYLMSMLAQAAWSILIIQMSKGMLQSQSNEKP